MKICCNGPAGVVSTITSILVACVAAGIIVITALELQGNSLTASFGSILDQASSLITTGDVNATETQCLLGYNSVNSNCVTLEVLGGITIALAILIGVLQCLTCNCCGFGGFLDWVFAAVGAALWVAMGVVVLDGYNKENKKDQAARDSKPPRITQETFDDNKQWRLIVLAMCWGMVALFGIIFLIGILKCCCARRKSKQAKVDTTTDAKIADPYSAPATLDQPADMLVQPDSIAPTGPPQYPQPDATSAAIAKAEANALKAMEEAGATKATY